jgi:hypothetical protein
VEGEEERGKGRGGVEGGRSGRRKRSGRGGGGVERGSGRGEKGRRKGGVEEGEWKRRRRRGEGSGGEKRSGRGDEKGSGRREGERWRGVEVCHRMEARSAAYTREADEKSQEWKKRRGEVESTAGTHLTPYSCMPPSWAGI